MDLFGNNTIKKAYRRDSLGRFAGEKQARYEKALKEANMWKQMYLYSESRMRGVSKVIRQKDELINKLKSK